MELCKHLKPSLFLQIEREKVATAVHAEIKAISGKKEHLFLLACREPVQLVGMKKQPSILGWKFPGTPVVADAPSFSRKPDTSQLRCDTATCGTVAGVAAHELDSLLGSPYQLSAWLCEGCLAPMDASNQARFTSSTGASHVQATHVVDTGCLHPLTTGLAFTSKPLLWLPFSGMESMECDQRGFGGHARYWDLKVQMKGNAAAVEFKNIAASEKDLVQAHLASAMELGGGGCEPPTGGGAAAGSSPSVPHAENASGAPAQIDDSEEEDSDFSEGGNSSEGGGGDKSGSDSGSDDSDDDSSDDGSEATFPEADDDNSVEFVEEDARDLSGAEEAVAAIAAEAAAGGGRKRSRRAAVGDAATGTDDDSDATEDESEVASKQARGLDG